MHESQNVMGADSQNGRWKLFCTIGSTAETLLENWDTLLCIVLLVAPSQGYLLPDTFNEEWALMQLNDVANIVWLMDFSFYYRVLFSSYHTLGIGNRYNLSTTILSIGNLTEYNLSLFICLFVNTKFDMTHNRSSK